MLEIGSFALLNEIPPKSNYVFAILTNTTEPSFRFLVFIRLKSDGITAVFERHKFDNDHKYPSFSELSTRITRPVPEDSRVLIIGSLSSPIRIKRTIPEIEELEFEIYE